MSSRVDPTEAELASLSLACQRLWDLDSDRLTPGQEYAIFVQKAQKDAPPDAAPRPLFIRVDESVFSRPTYQSFRTLLDNYISKTGRRDEPSPQELAEVDAFLGLVMETAPMQYAHNYLVAQGAASDDKQDFLTVLKYIWFAPYDRDGRNDSSGFEHVFVGEVDTRNRDKKEKVGGFHSWIRYWLEESKGNIDYRGYYRPSRRNSEAVDDRDQVLTVQFTWKVDGQDVLKEIGGFFVGTSPEFEFALYTLCFLLGAENNRVEVDRYDLNIKCFAEADAPDGPKVGTAYAEVLAEDPSNLDA